MNHIDALKENIDDGAAALWRNVRPMPEDKLDWRPAAEARTARELLEELVMTADFTADQLRTKKTPEMDFSEKSEPRSLEQLEAAYTAAIGKFLAVAEAFPESELRETVELPWGTMSYLQILSYPYWNLMYHYGQISYIQTMYGDKEMR